MFTVMDYVPRGELFTAWKRLEHFSEALVRICIAELAIAIGESALIHTCDSSLISNSCKDT